MTDLRSDREPSSEEARLARVAEMLGGRKGHHSSLPTNSVRSFLRCYSAACSAKALHIDQSKNLCGSSARIPRLKEPLE